METILPGKATKVVALHLRCNLVVKKLSALSKVHKGLHSSRDFDAHMVEAIGKPNFDDLGA